MRKKALKTFGLTILSLLCLTGVFSVWGSYSVYSADASADLGALHENVNSYRAEKSLGVLDREPSLDASAAEKCQSFIRDDYWEHNNPVTGETPWDVIARHYTANHMGENLSGGYSTPSDISNAWKESASHNENLVDPEFSKVGYAKCFLKRPLSTRVFVVQHLSN